VSDLCAAAVEWSDNAAANLLLSALGGPAAITRYARLLGDSITRLDRTEPTLNTAIAGDERDIRESGALVLGVRTRCRGQRHERDHSEPSRHGPSTPLLRELNPDGGAVFRNVPAKDPRSAVA